MAAPETEATRLLSQEALQATATSILAMSEPSGAIPWTIGEHTDIWNHVEAAMALTVAGRYAEAERAYDWAASMQRPDGSMPLKIVAGEVEDPSGDTNISAYLAVGVWHYWLVSGNREFVERFWPVVRRGLDWVCAMQLGFGGVAWSQEWQQEGSGQQRFGHERFDGERQERLWGAPAKINAEALLAGSASIHHSLQAGVALAGLVGEPQPHWQRAGGRLVHALRRHRDLFLDKSTFSMDWYYPVLGGAVRGEDGRALLASRWEEFVSDGLGVRCVDTNPWVTGAETCELVMALDAVGDPRARRLWLDVQHLRTEEGSYWTGVVFPEMVNWPVEHTTYTAAAVILAADALDGLSPGSAIMRGDGWAPQFPELVADCGCEA